MKRIQRLTLIGSAKGGVGKTVVAAAMVDGLALAGHDNVVIVDADLRVQGKRGDNATTLRGLYPGRRVREFNIAPAVRDVVAKGTVVLKHWEPVNNWLAEGRDVIIDMGANVDDDFMDWAEMSGVANFWADDGVVVRFVAVTTADQSALGKAAEALTRVTRIFGGAEKGRFEPTLVLNEVADTFERVADSGAMAAIDRIGGVTQIMIPKNISEIWTAAGVLKLSPQRVLEGGYQQFLNVGIEGLERTEAFRGNFYYLEWFRSVVERFGAVGMIPDWQVAVAAITARMNTEPQRTEPALPQGWDEVQQPNIREHVDEQVFGRRPEKMVESAAAE